MIVTVDELKRVLGLSLDATDEDVTLTRLINAKTAWVEGYTQRRFDVPMPHVQYADGSGTESLFLEWHVEADTVVLVERRPRMEGFRPWELLVEGDDWERRDQQIRFIRAWQVWPMCDEFRITYEGGYPTGQAPYDIQEIILNMAATQYLSDSEITSEFGGITSEKIGDYNYSASTVAGSVVIDAVSGIVGVDGMKTLNRYKRRFV